MESWNHLYTEQFETGITRVTTLRISTMKSWPEITEYSAIFSGDKILRMRFGFSVLNKKNKPKLTQFEQREINVLSFFEPLSVGLTLFHALAPSEVNNRNLADVCNFLIT